MIEIKYAPDAADKLRGMKKAIAEQYGTVNIYHEKEDFMWQLFRIDTTPQETIAYWKE